MDYNRENRSGGRGPKKFGGGGGGRGFGRPSFGGRGRDDRRDDRPMMHKAICDECGDRCEVPFKPSGERPVLCNDCFRQDSPRRDRDDRPRHRDRDERPRGDKEFGAAQPTNKVSNESIEQLKERVELLNTKLDKILKMITPVATKEAQQEAAESVKKPKAKKVKTTVESAS